MSNIVSCKKCGTQFNAAGYEPGVQFACSGCGALVTVPDEYDEPVPTVVDPDAPVRARTGKKKKKKAGSGRRAPDEGGGRGGKGSGKGGGRGGRGGGAAGGGGRGQQRGNSRRGGGRGGRDDDDDRRGGRRGGRQESNNMGLIVGGIVGGVALLLIVLVMMNGGSTPTPADGDGAGGQVDDEEARAAAEKAAREAAEARAKAYKNDDAVKKAATAFIDAIKAGDQDALERVFDLAKWTEQCTKNAETRKMTPKDFVDKFYSCKGEQFWTQYYSQLEVFEEDPFMFKDKPIWFYPNDSKGRARWKAKHKFGKKEKAIQIELEFNEEKLEWKVVMYDDEGYKPWDGLPTEDMFRVVFEGKEYHVPESEYMAHKDEYKAEKRMPPAPWNKPKEDTGSTPPPGPGPGTENPGPGPGPDPDPVSSVPAGKLDEKAPNNGWPEKAWKKWEIDHYDDCEEIIIDGGEVDEGLSSRFINLMIDCNRGDGTQIKKCMQARRMLVAMYGADGPEYSLTNPLNWSPAKNDDAIQKWKELHVETFAR